MFCAGVAGVFDDELDDDDSCATRFFIKVVYWAFNACPLSSLYGSAGGGIK